MIHNQAGQILHERMREQAQARKRARKQAEQDRYDPLRDQSAAASGFAGVGESGFADRTQAMGGLAEQLGRQARGEDSFSAEQLRQSMQQGRAAQQSMAAGARPGNQAMMARTAAMQMGQLGAGLAGQQALAGIAERQSAAQSLGGMLGGMRGQDLQAALGGRGQAIGAEGTILGDQTQRSGQPQPWERALGAAGGVAGLAALSDERKKERIRDGSASAQDFLRALSARRYEYSDPEAPGAARGEQLGVMAQDLERTPMGRQAVVDTPGGKMVDGGRLATTLAAALAQVNDRVEDLEEAPPQRRGSLSSPSGEAPPKLTLRERLRVNRPGDARRDRIFAPRPRTLDVSEVGAEPPPPRMSLRDKLRPNRPGDARRHRWGR